jgi:hypothetical protein
MALHVLLDRLLHGKSPYAEDLHNARSVEARVALDRVVSLIDEGRLDSSWSFIDKHKVSLQQLNDLRNRLWHRAHLRMSQQTPAASRGTKVRHASHHRGASVEGIPLRPAVLTTAHAQRHAYLADIDTALIVARVPRQTWRRVFSGRLRGHSRGGWRGCEAAVGVQHDALGRRWRSASWARAAMASRVSAPPAETHPLRDAVTACRQLGETRAAPGPARGSSLPPARVQPMRNNHVLGGAVTGSV